MWILFYFIYLFVCLFVYFYRDINGLMVGDLTLLKQGPGDTPHRVLCTAGGQGGSLHSLGEGEVASYRGIDLRLA